MKILNAMHKSLSSKNINSDKKIYNHNKHRKNNVFQHLIKNGCFLYFLFIWCDFWFRILVYKEINWPGLGLNLLFSFSLSLFLVFFISLFKRKLWNPVTVAISLLTIIVFSAQYIYHAFFRTLFTWFSVLHGAQVTEFASDIFTKIRENLHGILLFFLPLILFLFRNKIHHLFKKTKSNVEHKKNNYRQQGSYQTRKALKDKVRFGRIYSLLGALLVSIVSLSFIYFGDQSVNSAYDLYFETNDPYIASNKIGLITAMGVDLRHLIFPQDKNPAKIDLNVMNPNQTNEISRDDEQPFDTETIKNSSPDESQVKDDNTSDNQAERQPQVLPIDFETIMANTNDTVLLDMDNYFSNVTPSKTNDHTGIFKGYNLIFITAEGYSKYSPHPQITPTLWHMQEKGIKFTNFYNPLWGVSTSDGEYTGITGLSPKAGVWSMLESAENYMALCPGRMLQRVGYSTSAWHNHTYDYYGRDVSHPNLGYDTYKGLGNGLDVTPTWPESDLEMMELTLDTITASEPFHAYYMTVSGHMVYDYNGNYIAYKNKDLVADLPYSVGAQAYMATQIELDKAMEYLLEGLRDKGMADRTLIVINADHYPYGLEKNDYDELAGHQLEESFEVYENSLIFYVDGMEAETVDRPCFTLDIVPTIYNLMGLPFDSRLLMGTDVFSDKDPLVYFADRSWITDKGKFNAVTGEFFANEDVKLLDQDTYINQIQQEVNLKRDLAALILDYDYYSHILSEETWLLPNKESGYLD